MLLLNSTFLPLALSVQMKRKREQISGLVVGGSLVGAQRKQRGS